MFQKIKKWANSEVTVNCLWYYVLVLAVFVDLIMEGIRWVL